MFVKKLYRSVRAEDAALFTLSFLWICVIIQCVFLSGTDTRSVSAQAAGSPPVLILDPGHGGADGGAVAPDGTAESVMTRDTEEITYPSQAKTIASMKKWDTRRRVEIAESVDSSVFLSIHQNIYPSSGPHGSQVLYAQNEPSRALAELIQSRLTAALLPENRRVPVPAGKDIYIMSHVQCTAVLVECGFLSHPQELSLLQSADYQKKIASVLTACYLQFTEKGVL